MIQLYSGAKDAHRRAGPQRQFVVFGGDLDLRFHDHADASPGAGRGLATTADLGSSHLLGTRRLRFAPVQRPGPPLLRAGLRGGDLGDPQRCTD